MIRSLKHLPFAWWLFALAFGLSTLSFSFEYVFDDHPILVSNSAVHGGLRGIPTLLSTDLFHSHYQKLGTDAHLTGGRYRPLLPISAALEVAVFGQLHPVVSHVVQGLLYASVAVLVLHLFHCIGLPNRTANLASCLFVFMPLHVEIWCNIKSRDELLCLLFLLVSLTGWKHRISLSCLLLFLALLAKEYAIFFPAFVLILHGKPSCKQWLMLAGTVGAYLLLRCSVLGLTGSSSIDGLNSLPDFSFAERITYHLALVMHYTKTLLLQWPLSCDYSRPHFHGAFPGWQSVLGLLMLLALCWGVWNSRTSRATRLGSAFILFPLLLVNNPFLYTGVAFAERFLFLPSLGLCLIFASTLTHRPAPLFILTAIHLPLSILRSQAWQSEEALFTTDVQTVPRSALLQHNAGVVTGDKTRIRTALSLYPHYTDAMINLGNLLLDDPHPDFALVDELWAEASQRRPHDRNWTALYTKRAHRRTQAGIRAGQNGDLAAAESHFRAAIASDAHFSEAYARLMELARLRGRFAEADRWRQHLPSTVAFPAVFDFRPDSIRPSEISP